MRFSIRLVALLVPVLMLVAMACSTDADPPTAAKPAAQLLTVRDYGAIGDGKADDTAAIQRAVDARTGDIHLPRGVYKITKPILIELDKVGFTSVSGSGTATIVMAGPGPALKFVGTHGGTASPASVKPNVWLNQRMPTVDGIEIVGAHEEAVGIEVTGTMKMTITRVAVREALHGIHLTTRNRNVIVSNCHLYKNRGVGLYLDDVDLHQINVNGSHISYNAAGGIVSRAGCVRNLHINGCDIEANTVNVLIDSDGSKAATAEVAVVGCTLQHSGGPDSANVRFIGADDQGKRCWGHLTVANNVMSDVETNIDIQKARGVSITGNTVWTGYKYNLRIVDSSDVVVGANSFDRNPKYRDDEKADNAVLISGCDDITITGLHVTGVHRAPAGVVIENSRRMNVANCTILDCDTAGLLLRNVSICRFSDCLIGNDPPLNKDWQPVIVQGCSDLFERDNLLGKKQ